MKFALKHVLIYLEPRQEHLPVALIPRKSTSTTTKEASSHNAGLCSAVFENILTYGPKPILTLLIALLPLWIRSCFRSTSSLNRGSVR